MSESQLSSATRRWSFMQLIVCCYQIAMKMINKSKQAAGLFVNVIQVKIHFVQNVHFNQRRNQETQGRSQSHHDQRRQISSQMHAQITSYVLLCALFAFLVFMICSSLISLHPPSSLASSSSVAVSSKSEDSALTASLTASSSSMATQQQVSSAQSLQEPLVKIQELTHAMTCRSFTMLAQRRIQGSSGMSSQGSLKVFKSQNIRIETQS